MLEAAGSLIAGHAAGKLLDKVTSQFHTYVIERWTRRRARHFFEQFCTEIASGNTEGADAFLAEIVDDETCSEVLYDAYRAVALSKSKTLGPRIIAILTAQLVTARREADYHEDLIFQAAEQMNDDELTELASFCQDQERDADNPDRKTTIRSKQSHSIDIEWSKEQFDSAWHRETNISLAPLDLAQCLGTWAAKAKGIGLLSDDVTEETWEYPEDCERFNPEPGSAREITWGLCLHASCLQLARLVGRASSSIDAEPTAS